MVIKKFIAATMSEALAQVKNELGEDAVILQSRKVEKNGLLSFMGRSMIEVTAATPDRNPTPPKPTKPVLDERMRETIAKTSSRTSFDPSTLGTRHHGRPEGQQGAADANLRTRRSNPLEENSQAVSEMRERIDELQDTVRQLASHLKYKNAPTLPPVLSDAWKQLVENGTEEKIATDLLQRVHNELGPKQYEEEEVVESKLHDFLADLFKTSPIPERSTRSSRPLVIALVGPTGVGKTTTIAKMATNRAIFGGRDVAMISTDTYRVAAVEQLKTFASIAGLPIDVVYRPEELPVALEKHKNREVVLIDTAGRSQNDSEALQELKAFMDHAQPDEVMLVLSAGTRKEDQQETIRKFGVVAATRVIVTKLDEIAGAGHLLSLSTMLPKQWSYLTTGQSVPDDIVEADKILLAAMAAKHDYFDQLRASGFVLPDPKP
ncbi:flagellar biosynthesis protein FlhF [bacterium]|nr:flagellar biosynthesis protein FlhF [bacterium]